MSKKRTMLGRDAADCLEDGPDYYEEDGKLIWVLYGHEEEMDPAAAIKALKADNQRQAEGAKTASLRGEWYPLARIKAREQLIAKIAETFNLDPAAIEDEAEADDEANDD